jgi:hypothetical protein
VGSVWVNFSLQIHTNQNWPAFKFPQEIKTPLDGVLSASRVIPIWNFFVGFKMGIPNGYFLGIAKSNIEIAVYFPI